MYEERLTEVRRYHRGELGWYFVTLRLKDDELFGSMFTQLLGHHIMKMYLLKHAIQTTSKHRAAFILSSRDDVSSDKRRNDLRLYGTELYLYKSVYVIIWLQVEAAGLLFIQEPVVFKLQILRTEHPVFCIHRHNIYRPAAIYTSMDMILRL